MTGKRPNALRVEVYDHFKEPAGKNTHLSKTPKMSAVHISPCAHDDAEEVLFMAGLNNQSNKKPRSTQHQTSDSVKGVLI